LFYQQISFKKEWDFRDFDSWKNIPVSELPKCFGKLRRQPTCINKAYKAYGDDTIYAYFGGIAYKSLSHFEIDRLDEKSPKVILLRLLDKLFRKTAE